MTTEWNNEFSDTAVQKQQTIFFIFNLVVTILLLIEALAFGNLIFLGIYIILGILSVVAINSNKDSGRAKTLAIADTVCTIILVFALIIANLMQPKTITHSELLVYAGTAGIRLLSSALLARVL